MIRAFLILALTFGATTLQARCKGSNLRNLLTPQYQELLKQEVAQVPFAYGNHWIATKGERRIHIVGTQHSGDSRMRAMMRTLRSVIKSADAVLLEVDSAQLATSDQQLQANPSLVFLAKGKKLSQMMTSQEWLMLRTSATFAGLRPEITAKMQPWLLSILINRTGCGGRGIASYAGLDDRIERTAIRAGVPVGSLESILDGFRALSSQALPDQLRLLQLDLVSTVNFDDQIVTQTEAYFNGTLTEAKIIQKWTLYRDVDISRPEVARLLRQWEARILDRRNRAWIPVILGSKAKTLVVAVGALHLPGRAGVLNLLKSRGFTLVRGEL